MPLTPAERGAGEHWRSAVESAMKPVLDEYAREALIAQVVDAQAIIEALRQAQADVARQRRAAVRHLRATMTLQEIADAAGITFGRVRQIQQG